MNLATDMFMLYIPFNAKARAPWRVLERAHVLGVFSSQHESLTFALRIAGEVARRDGTEVRLMVEEAHGAWKRVPSELFVDAEPVTATA